MSKVQNICVISFLTFTFIVGLFVFSRGFLLNRRIIKDRAGPCAFIFSENRKNVTGHNENFHNEHPISSYTNWCNESPMYSKFILLLVDALKFDFVQRMKHLSQVLQRSDDDGLYSCLFKFMADPPTTTMQRLKALTTGTMPTFIDASANFNSYEVEEDSLIYQLFAAGKRLAFLGDDTWLSLFSRDLFTSPFVEAFPSFNAWDLDTVDRAVNSSIREVILPENRGKWDVLLAHILGVDHCGHRYGPSHPEMARKLNETDELIKFLTNSMSDDTLLVIFGDHGMTGTGDHGGDSRDESEAGLIIISKDRTGLRCPALGRKGNAEVAQIDLVPTLAALMGVPIPYSSIGEVIPNLLPQHLYESSVLANVAQVHRYVRRYSSGSDDAGNTEEVVANSLQSSLQHLYDKLMQSFKDSSSSSFVKSATTYLSEAKEVAKNTWTQFDVPVMYTGIAVSTLSALCLGLFLYLGPAVQQGVVKYPLWSWAWPSVSHFAAVTTFVLKSLASTRFVLVLTATVTGLISFFSVLLYKSVYLSKMLFDRKTFAKKKKIPFFKASYRRNTFIADQSEAVALILYGLTCLGVFSNSYVINEGYILGFVLLTVVSIHILCSRSSLASLGLTFSGIDENKFVKLPVVRRHFICSWTSFVCLAVIIRLGHVFFRCREELQECTEEFLLHKQLASLPSDWIVHKFIRYGIELVSLAVFVVVFRHWLIYRQISGSSKPGAFVARYIPTVLVVLNCAFRALQGLPFEKYDSIHILPIIDHLPKVFQFVGLSALLVVSIKPLCCVGRFRPSMQSLIRRSSRLLPRESDAHNGAGSAHRGLQNGLASGDRLRNKRSSVLSVSGDENLCEDVYSSSILTFGVLLTLLLVQVTSEGISPAVTLILYAAVCLVGIYRNSTNHSLHSWSPAVAWCLASQYFFYATGHQPVFSAIPWDSAFVASSNSTLGTDPDSILTWIPPACSVLGNMHVSQIVFTVVLPLLIYWKADQEKHESLMGANERSSTYLLYGKYLVLHAIKLLACMLCAAWQRRHLMVWKIFAPKLIFETISFIVTSSCGLLSMLLLTRLDYSFRKVIRQDRKNNVQMEIT